ncbi:MAG: dihydrodipicolinate synthase family protein, partial [Phycisphaerae bacterium]|nr:dihydrodipicolinate synthase family protein [Phycisphaerae bacterium]
KRGMPAEVRRLCDLIQAENLHDACSQHLRLFPLFKGMLSMETNPIPIKAAMSMAGLCSDEVRLPLAPLAEQHRDPLAELLREFDIDA